MNGLTPAAHHLRVIVYVEEGEFVAHLLEMDIVGTGDTAEEAEENLLGALQAQLEYCHENGVDPFRPAPDEVFAKWEQAQRHEFSEQFTREVKVNPQESPEPARPVRDRAAFVTYPDFGGMFGSLVNSSCHA